MSSVLEKKSQAIVEYNKHIEKILENKIERFRQK